MSWMLSAIGNFLFWLTGTRWWVAFARHWLGYFTFRVFSYPKFPMADYFKIVDAYNEDPDALYVFVSSDTASLEWKAINMATGGVWGHCGIVVMESDGLHIHHMKASGRQNWHLLEELAEIDNFAMMKLPLTKDQVAVAKARLKAILDAPSVEYDFQIEMSQATIDLVSKGTAYTPEQVPPKLYCSEEVYLVAGGLVPGYSLTVEFGRRRFEPDNAYLPSCVVYENRTVPV